MYTSQENSGSVGVLKCELGLNAGLAGSIWRFFSLLSLGGGGSKFLL